MDALAAIHASSWDRPQTVDDEWLERFDGGVFITMGEIYRAVWPAFADRFGHLLPADVLELGRRIQDGFEDLQRAAAAEAPLTLCHGDYRLGQHAVWTRRKRDGRAG